MKKLGLLLITLFSLNATSQTVQKTEKVTDVWRVSDGEKRYHGKLKSFDNNSYHIYSNDFPIGSFVKLTTTENKTITAEVIDRPFHSTCVSDKVFLVLKGREDKFRLKDVKIELVSVLSREDYQKGLETQLKKIESIDKKENIITEALLETSKFQHFTIDIGAGEYNKSDAYLLTGYSKTDFAVSVGLFYVKHSSGNYGVSSKEEIPNKLDHFIKSEYNEVSSMHFGINIPITRYVTITPMVGKVRVSDVYEGHITSSKEQSRSIKDFGWKVTCFPLVSKKGNFSAGGYFLKTNYEGISMGISGRIKFKALTF